MKILEKLLLLLFMVAVLLALVLYGQEDQEPSPVNDVEIMTVEKSPPGFPSGPLFVTF